MLPVSVDGEQVKLAVITYKPAGAGPFPTLIFHHGSTGSGTNPSIFARPYDPRTLAEWFTARGWAVVLPSRRGRGGSEGTYDEGFAADVARRHRPGVARHRRDHAGDPGAVLRRSRQGGRRWTVARRRARRRLEWPPARRAEGRRQLRGRLARRKVLECERGQPDAVQARRRLRPADDMALRRQGSVLFAGTQPRKLCGLRGGWRQRRVSRIHAARGADRPSDRHGAAALERHARRLPCRPGPAGEHALRPATCRYRPAF